MKYRQTVIITSLLALFAIAPVAFIGGAVSAVDRDTVQQSKESESSKKTEPYGEEINEVSDKKRETVEKTEKKDSDIDKKQAKKEKLTPKKLAKCEERQADIQTTVKNIAQRGSKQYEVFEKIATRTQDFVTAKQLTVESYASLVAAVTTTHDIAKLASEKVQATSLTWSCSIDGPKETLAEFKAAKQAEIAAMKDYKNAVRALLVAVKTAAETKEGQ